MKPTNYDAVLKYPVSVSIRKYLIERFQTKSQY